MLLTKSLPVWLKTAGQSDSALEPGQFEAIVSAFGNKDSYGEVVKPGAFRQDVADFHGGKIMPVIWSHDWQNPESHIGYALDMKEVGAAAFGQDSPAGLYVKGQLDVGEPRADKSLRLMKSGRVTQFSFAYDEIESGLETVNGEEVWALNLVKTYEVGPTLVGANQDTTLLGAKRTIIDLATRMANRSAKTGSRHSATDMATLTEIHSALGKLGVPCATDDGKSHPLAPEPTADVDGRKAEDAPGTPAAEPVQSQSVDFGTELELLLLASDN